MLINSDFERHGFVLYSRTEDNSQRKYIPKYCSDNLKEPTHILTVTKARSGISKVNLWAGKEIGFELMWTPNQLRDFLLFHKVIMP